MANATHSTPGGYNKEESDLLPPIDRGWGAWSVALGGWLCEAILWGCALNFGIFQAYYTTHPPFSTSPSSIPIIGVLASSLPTLGVPFVTPIALRYPQYRRHICVAGWSACVLSLVLASFATQVWQLILTQGLLFGAGWATAYTAFFIMANEWWVKRRGVVFGIVFGASGVSGLALPFVLEAGLERYGARTTLRGYAVAVFVLVGPAMLLIKPRLPLSAHMGGGGQSGPNGKARPRNLRFLRHPRFYVFAVAVFLQGIGFYLPNIFLPSFAQEVGLSHAQAAALLALLSLAQVGGQIGLGHLSDLIDVHIPLALSALVPAMSVLLLWGFAKSFAPLVVFALAYSFFGASNSVFWSRMCTLVADAGDDGGGGDAATAMMLYGFFSVERGIGGALSGPVSTALLRGGVDVTGYGIGKYGRLIVFVGGTMVLSSLCGLGWFVRNKVAYTGERRLVREETAEESGDSNQHDDAQELDRLVVDGVLKGDP